MDIDTLLEYLPSISSEAIEPIKFQKICDKKNCIDGKVKESYWTGYDYYYEQQFQPLQSKYKKTTYSTKNKEVNGTYSGRSYNAINYEHGKNKRAIWEVNTANSKEQHSASFSEQLVITPIKATIPQYVCSQCGLPFIKMYRFIYEAPLEIYQGNAVKDYTSALAQNPSDTKRRILNSMRRKREFVGYAKCQCHVKPFNGFGFDSFMGSGSTANACLNLARDFFGVELNPDYINIGLKRIKEKKLNIRLDQYLQ